jgi:hypothetical protein
MKLWKLSSKVEFEPFPTLAVRHVNLGDFTLTTVLATHQSQSLAIDTLDELFTL